ncbi:MULTISPECIES: hypothetical protein [unclassified Methylobacterium]|uniref:hypothetical protein n=1 Tax=unclassified Methylobacterium TaxID=2615210 RepID=UPI0036FFAC7E
MSFDLLDPAKKCALSEAVAPAFDIDPGFGAFYHPDFLKRKQWVAAIFEGDFRDDGDQICQGLSSAGIFTVACGGLAEYMTDWYSLSPQEGDLKEVRNKYFEPSYFISDYLESFCIVSDSDYYWSIAADIDKIENKFEINIKKCISEFRSDIAAFSTSDDEHSRKIGSMLQRYLEICEASLGNATRIDGRI